MVKEPCRTSSLTGGKWMVELQEGNRTRIFENFRMEREVFYQLCDLLHTKYGLETGRKVSVQEQVAIFLYIVGGDIRNRNAQERFQHSGETISKYFKNVLKAVTRMSIDWVKPQPRNGVHPYIRRKRKYYPHFKDCIGAIDGTHIKAYISPDKQPRLIGRKGYATQNIMAACDFDMCFTFYLSGWEGSAHDTRIFLDTIRNPSYNFPKPQGDEFYLVDAGYPNMKGYLAPYKGERYHLAQFEHGQPPQNAQEKFNQAHSSLRSVIERTFGVWKARWPMIKDIPPNYSWATQVKLVCATMAIHNFIRRSEFRDIAFDSYDRFADYVPNEEEGSSSQQARHGNYVDCDDTEMEVRRHNICMSICRRN
ncbi:unnamed protein product [Camellia sinensis]